ncbi:IS256 family transposase [Candidatus Palauibacter soopunensis]|uniref:IS256 family transposase n=1 Tax=Candidatus Palauibacter soopunensis TaxID=3056739 RepID=UPI0023A243E2|nr:IS256 family transposase [Candidatus Palauibacter soopunensis]MDE2877872.1 IS256 family transposase [Candidatus Palauibacter soopunensis]
MAGKKKDATEREVNELLDSLMEGRSPEEIMGGGGLLDALTKRVMERVLEGELTDHLGYEKRAREGHNGGNSRNGRTRKRVKTDTSEFEIEVPRDRDSTFDPKFVRKGQRRLGGFDEKVIALYARGMTTREIQGHLKELYKVEVSPSLISSVTDAVLDDVKAWQGRPLDVVYPIVYLDAIHVKVRSRGHVQTHAVYLALALNLEGNKELLGLWVGEAEGATFWLSVLTELRNRGVEDILIASIDGLKGFPEAIESVFPKTQVQLCVVHLVRGSLRFVSWKERKAVARDLRAIYRAPSLEAAETALEAFSERWDERFPVISRKWRANWANLTPFFDYPPEIRKVMYTTNAIEALNAQLTKVTRKRGAFPTPEAVRKVLYLAIDRASQRWTRPVQDWTAALNHLSIVFEGRVPV